MLASKVRPIWPAGSRRRKLHHREPGMPKAWCAKQCADRVDDIGEISRFVNDHRVRKLLFDVGIPAIDEERYAALG